MHTVVIESLDNEGRGIARVDGKVIFIEGALPGEHVEYTSFRRKPSYEVASIARLARASSQRVTPLCPHFGTCGGCALQHLNTAAQTAVKQRVLRADTRRLAASLHRVLTSESPALEAASAFGGQAPH
jgi:23S rRNA (uracil1939-C5)-methyltransferase